MSSAKKPPVNRERLSRLKKRADLEPASEAALLWTFVWGFATCALLWLFAAQAFPLFDGVQGVSLPWVGALMVAGGVIAAGLCYLLYRYRRYIKNEAIAELKAFIAQYEE